MPVRGVYLLAAGGGALLLWSGIKGHRWSTVLRDVISGKQVPSTQDLAIQTSPAAYESSAGGSTVPSTNISAIGGSSTKNKAIGAALATAYGWGPGTTNWTSLVTLWDGESGWDNHAKNPSSGAYGIPQALPASKMGALANPPLSSASAQITWGLRYIKQVYGSPDAALAAWESRSPHWY